MSFEFNLCPKDCLYIAVRADVTHASSQPPVAVITRTPAADLIWRAVPFAPGAPRHGVKGHGFSLSTATVVNVVKFPSPLRQPQCLSLSGVVSNPAVMPVAECFAVGLV